MFEEFIDAFKESINDTLPGKAGQRPLKPYLPGIDRAIDIPAIRPKYSAVMALIYPIDHQPHLLLMERPEYDGVHSKQISFPGGKMETIDDSPLATALRETKEEVGIDPSKIEVIAPLTEVYVAASNFIVYPFIGYLKEKPNLKIDAKEVADTLEIPIQHFFNKTILQEKTIESKMGYTLMAPYYDLDGKMLWGATAMMVSEIAHIIHKSKYPLSLT